MALLLLIARAREVGLSLDDIRDVTAAEGAERAEQASRLLKELGRKERTFGDLRADLERIVLEAAG